MRVIGQRLPGQPGATLIWLISTLTALAFVVGCSDDTTAVQSAGSPDAAPNPGSPWQNAWQFDSLLEDRVRLSD